MTPENETKLKDQINACYLKVLNRQADILGLDFYFNAIKKGNITIEKLADELAKSKEFKEYQKMLKIPKLEFKVKKPIFIIGVPRTGTTFLYNRLCFHPDVAWFSHLDLKYWIPKKDQEKYKKLYTKMKADNKPIPRREESLFVFGTKQGYPLKGTDKVPIEAETLWRPFLEAGSRDVSMKNRVEVIKIIEKFISDQKKSRFLNKAPQNSMRAFAIQKVFPDSKFIHTIRDPRAVVASMIVRHENEGGWDPGIKIKNKSKYDKLDFVQKWAWIYKEVIDEMYEFSRVQSKDTLLTIQYEKLIEHPFHFLREIIKFCELEPFEPPKGTMPPMRIAALTKWTEKLKSEDEKKIFDIVSPSLEKMNLPYKL